MRSYHHIMTITDIHMDHSKYDSKDLTEDHAYLGQK